MDRFANIIAFAGLGCFALAFALSGLYPYLITASTRPEASIAELAQDVPATFHELKERFPVAFAAAHAESDAALTARELAGMQDGDPRHDASEAAWQAAYARALQHGRDRYVAEGCWHCHSQYVRPVSNESVRFGPVSTWVQDHNALQRPVLWGTRRVGPDLTYEGRLRSNDWHVAHFLKPKAVTPGSVMPPFPWFFRDGWQVHRRIDPEVAERTGLSADTSYPLPGVYDTQAEAESALGRAQQELPSSLAAERERLFVTEGNGLNQDGLAMLAYIQWLGTWMPPENEPE